MVIEHGITKVVGMVAQNYKDDGNQSTNFP
jgi:hypothetical protein